VHIKALQVGHGERETKHTQLVNLHNQSKMKWFAIFLTLAAIAFVSAHD